MILVLTYGKVCTTSLRRLLGANFPGRFAFSHGLGSWIVDPLDRFAAATTADTTGLRAAFDNAPIRERLAHARATGETVTIVSGVRDPVARSLSVAMQNLEVAFADCLVSSPEAAAEMLAGRIADLWLRDTPDDDPVRTFLARMIRAPDRWFREELEEPFGFDLAAPGFDRGRGYAVHVRDGVRLMLFRHENAPAAIEAGLAELFPGVDVALPHDNDGTAKPTAAIYRALQHRFRLPREALRAIYDHPHVRAFYGDDEIAAAIDRWAEPPPRRAWVPPPPPAAPRAAFAAAVFVPLRNHARWIGGQLDSLFAQWRPDVELVLVDDGSDDGSLAAVTDRLSGRPEVAATVMRNATAIGHGMLATVTALTRAPVIVQADSDDVALPGRLDTLLARFAAEPELRLVTSNALLLSEDGIPIGLLDTRLPDVVLDDPAALADQQEKPYWLGASSAYHRSVLEAFPPLDPDLCPYGLDLLTGYRATLLGHQRYLARPLVGWRQHARNSHRAIGSHGRDPVSLEHLGAIHVMVRAQRLRDLAWLRGQGRIAPERAAAVEARWQADQFSTLDDWIRARNRLTGAHAAPAPRVAAAAEQAPHVPAVPPILTLRRGVECSTGPAGAALARWPGISRHDQSFVWTARQAAVVLRVPDPDATALVVTLAGLPFVDRQQVALSLDFGPEVEATVIAGEARRVTVPLVRRRDPVGGLVTLSIHVPAAEVLSKLDPTSRDGRIFGAALFALEVT